MSFLSPKKSLIHETSPTRLRLAPEGEYELNPSRRWRAFALLAVAFFMTIVDLTITNVALPTIGRKLHFP
jgi:hypothetical protein